MQMLPLIMRGIIRTTEELEKRTRVRKMKTGWRSAPPVNSSWISWSTEDKDSTRKETHEPYEDGYNMHQCACSNDVEFLPRFPRNSEAYASEFLENLEEIFICYW